MRSALYYPHSRIHSAEVLKTALLLWDHLELISPYRGYRADYADPLVAEGMELIGVGHCPTRGEQNQAHNLIEDFVTRPLPAPFFYSGPEQFEYDDDYWLYPEKFLPETVEMLHEAQMVGSAYTNIRVNATRSAGLSVMAILADCCAGSTKSRITDQSVAYATLTGLLGPQSENHLAKTVAPYDIIVPITVEVIDTPALDLRVLINFRAREARQGGHAYRDLRHRYVERIESFVKSLTHTKGAASDQIEIKRQFREDMRDNLAILKDELRLERKEALFSKEMLVAALATVGTVASQMLAVPLVLPDVFTAMGASATIGGLLAVRNKYLASRRSTLRKHPMAYLFEMRTFPFANL